VGVVLPDLETNGGTMHADSGVEIPELAGIWLLVRMDDKGYVVQVRCLRCVFYSLLPYYHFRCDRPSADLAQEGVGHAGGGLQHGLPCTECPQHLKEGCGRLPDAGALYFCTILLLLYFTFTYVTLFTLLYT
jgi:hypothetical protein